MTMLINDTESNVLSKIWGPGEDHFIGNNDNCSNDTIKCNTFCHCTYCAGDKCFICTTSAYDSCCICHDCNVCCDKEWSVITTAQVTVLLLFVFGIIFVVIMYFRSCNRATEGSVESSALQNQHNDEFTGCNSSQYYSIDTSRDRPPSYSEACSAPPLYGSPFNRVSMLEAPPVYPDTPKTSERKSHSSSIIPSIAHHI